MAVFNYTRQLLSNIRRLGKTGEGSRFWIGQIMVIVSTILGVYLAAYAGFERALEFDVLVNKRSAYHLIASLEAELKDNIEINNKLAKKISREQSDVSYFLNRNKMGDFVWQAMTETDKTFQVPAEILTGVRRYYQAIDVLREEIGGRKIPAQYFVKRVKEEHKTLKKSVLPAIDSEKKMLEMLMKKLDMDIS